MASISMERSTVARGVMTRRCRHLTRVAPWLLAVSLALRFVGSIPFLDMLFVDLRVYILGGEALTQPGTLYGLTYIDSYGDHLPFIYPPFAALLFYPLHFLPFPVVAWIWQLAVVAGLYGLVRISQRMLGGGSHRVAMLWTAAGIWFEPIRTILTCSQVGVFLTLAVLYAAYTSRSWLSGLLVGLSAGVKVTPAITGLYFVGMRRWAAVCFSLAAFLATVLVSAVIAPQETRQFFGGLFSRVPMPTATCLNQSWRGTVSRIVGYDAGRSLVLLVAIGVTAVLALLAWRELGRGPGGRDALASLLVVQLFGLTASPISWAHHWVWVVPLTIWLLHGPWRGRAGARVLGSGWIALMVIGVPTLLSGQQADLSTFSRPWYLAVAAAVYVPMTLVTFAWIIVASRTGTRRTCPPSEPKAESAPSTSAVVFTPAASHAERPTNR
uniref:Mannosyltransferase n=3 Tax=unclassified Mycobacterium TaxID=2642494 RepID=A0A5Q5BEG7_MYCSS